MAIVQEWTSRASDHTNIHQRIRKLAERRLAAMEKAADYIDQQFDNGNHPEMLMSWLLNLQIALDVDTLELLSRIIDRSTKGERLATALKYNDINEMAKAMHQLGYRIVPKKAVSEEPKAAVSVDTVGAIKQALGVTVLGASK